MAQATRTQGTGTVRHRHRRRRTSPSDGQPLGNEHQVAIVIRQHGTGKTKSSAADGSAKLLTVFIHKADESILGRLLVAARLRYVAASRWGTRRYLNMQRLAQAAVA
jgi:hypothetical protein